MRGWFCREGATTDGTCVKRTRNVSNGRYMREVLNIENFAEDRVDRPEDRGAGGSRNVRSMCQAHVLLDVRRCFWRPGPVRKLRGET